MLAAPGSAARDQRVPSRCRASAEPSLVPTAQQVEAPTHDTDARELLSPLEAFPGSGTGILVHLAPSQWSTSFDPSTGEVMVQVAEADAADVVGFPVDDDAEDDAADDI